MNRLSPRFVGCSTSLILGLVMLMGGCGPQDINDPDYLMQLKSSGVADALESGGPQAPQAGAPHAGMPDDSQAQGPQGQPQGHPSDGQPMGGGPAGGPDGPQGAPAGGPVVVAPPVVASAGPLVVIQAPTIVENFPTTVVKTAEVRLFAREVHHLREIHRYYPSLTDHTIINNTNVHHRYFTTIRNFPSHATRVCPTFATTMTAEVMPTVEVTAPMVESVIPCVGVACAPPIVAPAPCVGCFPLYTRGILPF